MNDFQTLTLPPRLLHNGSETWELLSASDNLQDAPAGNTGRPGLRPVAPATGFRAEGASTPFQFGTNLTARAVRALVNNAVADADVSAIVHLFYHYPGVVSAHLKHVYERARQARNDADVWETRDARQVAAEQCDVLLNRAPAASVGGGDFGDGTGDYIILKDPLVARQG